MLLAINKDLYHKIDKHYIIVPDRKIKEDVANLITPLSIGNMELISSNNDTVVIKIRLCPAGEGEYSFLFHKSKLIEYASENMEVRKIDDWTILRIIAD